jgi:hypothetical protein
LENLMGALHQPNKQQDKKERKKERKGIKQV